MEITEVRIVECPDNEKKCVAFVSIVFDGVFVVKDLKIIEGMKGMFLAFPDRSLTFHCQRCGAKNALRARYCQACGDFIGGEDRANYIDGHPKLHADIAHPICSEFRQRVEDAVFEEYDRITERRQTG